MTDKELLEAAAMAVTIKLTQEQTDYLLGVLELAEDEGPTGKGWQSAKLIEICEIVRAAASMANE